MTDQLKILFAGWGDIAQRAASRIRLQCFGLRRNPKSLPDNIVPIAADITNAHELTAVLSQVFDVVADTLTPGTFTEQAYTDSCVAGAPALSPAIADTEQSPQLVLWVSSSSLHCQPHRR